MVCYISEITTHFMRTASTAVYIACIALYFVVID